MPTKVLLLVLDGWGLSDKVEGNAIRAAETPNFDRLWDTYPSGPISSSGRLVGLPEGQMGNSEVGHITLGAGRTVYQPYMRISDSIEKGEIFDNKVLRDTIQRGAVHGKMHLMGMVSDGGVHSHNTHLYALLRMIRDLGPIENVHIHAFLDGRDTPPRSAIGYLEQLEHSIEEIGTGKVGTVTGRYYAMDRDKRWDRTAKAFDVLVNRRGEIARTPLEAVENAYGRDENDEFVLPTVICPERGSSSESGIGPEDPIILFNFRPDRIRQITKALLDDGFQGFKRMLVRGGSEMEWEPHRGGLVSMMEVGPDISTSIAFPPIKIDNTLGEIVSRSGKQLRIAETEKYAHVTFFFNNGREDPFPGEDRILVPSPKIATYDLQPSMSAVEVTDRLLSKLEEESYDLVVLNLANPDMVGHTGEMEATIEALETVDVCIGRIMSVHDGYALITGDHGNAEQMFYDGGAVTAHSSNPVPLIICGPGFTGKEIRLKHPLEDGCTLDPPDQQNVLGSLRDIGPTILDLLGYPVPEEMEGNGFIIH